MYIKIHLRPDAKDDSFKVINSELYEISVRAPAERGLANQRLLEILHEHHPNSNIKIVSGHLHPHKIVSVN